MNPHDEEKPQFVFTLSDDQPTVTPVERAATSASVSITEPDPLTKPVSELASKDTQLMEKEEQSPSWELRLEQLRHSKKYQSATDLPITNIFRPTLSPQAAAANLAHTLDTISMRTGRPSASPNNVSGQDNPDSTTFKPKPNHNNHETLLNPVQREQVYRAYLQEWQHRTNLEEEQRHAELNDTAILLQEDWLAAQSCLKKADDETPAACTIQLKQHHQAEVLQHKDIEEKSNDQQAESITEIIQADMNEHTGELPSLAESSATTLSVQPVIHVHLHVLEPHGAQLKAVTCLSENELLRQLTDKLRPHLADAMSGMVRTAIQKQTAHLISHLQQQLLDEIPETVEEILHHHLHRALEQIKKSQRNN